MAKQIAPNPTADPADAEPLVVPKVLHFWYRPREPGSPGGAAYSPWVDSNILYVPLDGNATRTLTDEMWETPYRLAACETLLAGPGKGRCCLYVELQPATARPLEVELPFVLFTCDADPLNNNSRRAMLDNAAELTTLLQAGWQIVSRRLLSNDPELGVSYTLIMLRRMRT